MHRLVALLLPCTFAATAEAQVRSYPLPPRHTGLLYLSGWATDDVGEFTHDGTPLRRITVPDMRRPRGVAVDDDGRLVVVSEGSARIQIVDLDGALVRTVQHGDLTSGTGVARAPNGDWYVGNFLPGRVLVFDPAWNHRSTLTSAGMDGVNCVAFAGDGSFAVSAAVTNRIVRFDAQHAPLGQIQHAALGSPMSIARDSRGHWFVSNGSSGVVIQFDPAWSPVRTFGGGTLASPQGIAIDERDVLTITNYSADVGHRYDRDGRWLGSFALTGIRTARNLTYQTSPLVLARAGTVDRRNGLPAAVLGVRGATKDRMGRVSLGATDRLTIDLLASPAGPTPGSAALWLWPGEPGCSDVIELPFRIGLFAFPLLGAGIGPLPAPSTIVDLPQGLGVTGTVTLQAVLLDQGSAAEPGFPISATDALVVMLR